MVLFATSLTRCLQDRRLMRAQYGTIRYCPDPLGIVTIRSLHDQPLHVILSERSTSPPFVILSEQSESKNLQ